MARQSWCNVKNDYIRKSNMARQGSNDRKTLGVCNRYNIAKGYGFITCYDGSGDVFVHHTDICADIDGFGLLQEGDEVEFDVVVRDNGRTKAASVSIRKVIKKKLHKRKTKDHNLIEEQPQQQTLFDNQNNQKIANLPSDNIFTSDSISKEHELLIEQLMNENLKLQNKNNEISQIMRGVKETNSRLMTEKNDLMKQTKSNRIKQQKEIQEFLSNYMKQEKEIQELKKMNNKLMDDQKDWN
eukprot:UN03985